MIKPYALKAIGFAVGSRGNRIYWISLNSFNIRSKFWWRAIRCEPVGKLPILESTVKKVDQYLSNNPASIYLLKVSNRKTKTSCEICSNLTIKTPKRNQGCSFRVFIVNFEHFSHHVLLFLLLTLSR